ncbi:adenosylcobalamin-dependent ribonucleoside-diphosphate reductase [Candidatus Woesearchaeota archaeon]|nr:adenosylcobalamin-dependent ribonucleoside-diphosphate reductase [Candidatus Woesearchaeota archaeon]
MEEVLPPGYEESIPKYKEYRRKLNLSPSALDLLKIRYLKRDADGNIVEDPVGMFFRVAKNIAQADKKYGGNVVGVQSIFFDHLVEMDFVPASPILMNAGNTLQFLCSDHALDVPDSVEEIFDVLKLGATIQQHGGGVGFSFSKIRPRKDSVSGMKNVAFGPMSVMKIFDTSFSAIIQGGRRSGANMAVLHISHPDVMSFIEAKHDLQALQNFNLSVALTDEFMHAVKEEKDFSLINPRNGEVVRTIPAKLLFDAIVEQSWQTGDPGVVFIDEMNRKYPFKEKKVLCTGSCGQYELESFEGVPYVHLNLPKSLIVVGGKYVFDEQKLRRIVRNAVHFLDNCVDMHKHPTPILETKSKARRKIGLGVLGFADVLFKMEISYGSKESLEVIRTMMAIIKEESRNASHALALQRGSFTDFKDSTHKKQMRNATITSIAPTGSTSIIAHTSQSIEPVYAFSFTTKTSEGEQFTILNEAFKEAIDALPVDRTAKIQLQFVDSVQKISWLDEAFKRVYRTAMDIAPEEHLMVMATFQEFVDNSISKTINLPNQATRDDVAAIIMKAHTLHCKGITLYRDGCRADQALATKKQTRLSAFEDEEDT